MFDIPVKTRGKKSVADAAMSYSIWDSKYGHQIDYNFIALITKCTCCFDANLYAMCAVLISITEYAMRSVCVCIQWILQESAGKHLWSRTMRIHSLVWPKTHVNHNAQMLSSWLIKHTRALVVSRIWTILDGHSHVEAGWVIFFFFIKN